MTSVLITGTNRGIGLGLVKYFLNHLDPPKILIAACRNPNGATELQELKKKNSNLYISQLDVTKFDTLSDFAKKVESIVGPNGLNLLINNAGAKLAERRLTLNEVTPEDYMFLYQINTMGPIFLTKALLPLIERASDANKDKPEGIKRAAILNISSTLGSVSLNDSKLYNFFAPSYRESKAALNQFSRSLAPLVEPKGIVVTVFCPGHVKTDLGGDEAPLTVDDSISKFIKVIYSIDKSYHNKFFHYDGRENKW